MKKRFFSIFLCILTLLSLLSVFTLSSSAESIEVDTSIYGRIYSVDGEDFNGGRSSNPVFSIYPISTNSSVNFGWAIKSEEGYKQFYTYKLDFEIHSIGDSTNAVLIDLIYDYTYFSNDLKWIDFIEDPQIDDGVISSGIYDLTDNVSYNLIYDTSATNIGIGKFSLIFTVTKETDFNLITPFFYGINSSDKTNIKLSIISIDMYRDYDQQIYQDLVYQQQQAIKNEIEQGFEQTNDSLGEIKDALTGDGVYDPPDPSFQEGIDNLGDKEAEVIENITQPIKLPNGTSVQIDQNTLNTLKVYYDIAYNAPTYEETMGDQIEKIFDVFMPYLGTVIYLSLFLGLAIAFLTGRRLI